MNLRSQINVAMKKVNGQSLTANMFQDNLKDTVKSFLAYESHTHLWITIKEKKYSFRRFSYGQTTGNSVIFPNFILCWFEMVWNEFPEIISKINGKGLSLEEISALSYFEKCDQLNSNPVLLQWLSEIYENWENLKLRNFRVWARMDNSVNSDGLSSD